MTTPTIDRLVRAHLEREAAGVDASALLASVRDRLNATQASRPRRSPPAAWRWRLLAAAAVVLAGVFGLNRNPAQANPEQLIRDAHAAHAQPVDRRYRVRIEPARGLARPHEF